MTEYKISQSEIDSNNVKSAPTHNVNEEPQVNKHIFDKLPELIADKYNRFVDAVYTKAETEAVIDERMQQAGGADMLQAVYDKNHNGVVDDAERLGGHLPEYFASQDTAVLKSGGAMTGPLTLSADPTENMQPATKQYVDKLAGKVLLWENAKPSSDFKAQTITVEAGYPVYYIYTKNYTDSVLHFVATVLPNGGTHSLMGHATKTIRYRTVKIDANGNVEFGTGKIYESYGGSTSDNAGQVIPIKIYGGYDW